MALTREELDHVAMLARLELDEAARQRLSDQLGRVLKYIEKLNELDTSNVVPLSHPGELANVFRPDEVRPSLPLDQVLANAPDQARGCFRVPRVIE
jgi:aspartyl-tRNA(Asn)/glutamyl-tRNA(Gln) amidotransferase subunit C